MKYFEILGFLGNNLIWKLVPSLIFHLHIRQNFEPRAIGQIAASQSNCRKWMMKFILCMPINMEVFCKVILSFWVSVTRNAQSTQKFVCLWNISINAWGMKFIFYLQINTIFAFRVIASLSVRIARQVQSTKNNQFTISLQSLKEKMKDKVDFFPADKCWRFLQIDSIILGVYDQACPNYLK